MAAKIPPVPQTLYDRDFFLWLQTTAEQLKNRQFDQLDRENLIEEIESMGRSERRAIESLLTLLLEHLLKLAYWDSARAWNTNHWRREIITFRQRIAKNLADSPSLKPYIREIFEESYACARSRVAEVMGVTIDILPETPIATLEQTLDLAWFPPSQPQNPSLDPL